MGLQGEAHRHRAQRATPEPPAELRVVWGAMWFLFFSPCLLYIELIETLVSLALLY